MTFRPGPRRRSRNFVRDEWLPVVNAHDGAHFAWYGMSTSAARFADEAITIVAFDDMPAFDQFATTERESTITRALRDRRNGVQTRLLRPIDYTVRPLRLRSRAARRSRWWA